MSLYFEINGNGVPVVLLHGMAASGRYFEKFISMAPKDKYKFITIDLPGFGRSPQPTSLPYDYDMYTAAILATIQEAGIQEKCIVIGHSMGSLVALRLAAHYPKLIDTVIACNIPYYPDRVTARKLITKSTYFRKLAYYGVTSRVLCTLWCSWMRPVTKRIAPYYLPSLPPRVAQDSVLHTWQAYSKSLAHIIENQDIAADITATKMPTIFIFGSEDRSLIYFKESGILSIRQSNELIIIEGSGHQTPLEAPALLLKVLQKHAS